MLLEWILLDTKSIAGLQSTGSVARICVPLSVPPHTHPVRAFPDIVRPVRLPVCNSLHTTLTGPPEDV